MLYNLQNVANVQNFQLDNLVDFERSGKTRIYLQILVLIQPKTCNILAEFFVNFWDFFLEKFGKISACGDPRPRASDAGGTRKGARSVEPRGAFRDPMLASGRERSGTFSGPFFAGVWQLCRRQKLDSGSFSTIKE